MIKDDKTVDGTFRLERLLARQLRYGVWLASTVSALGMIIAPFGWRMELHGQPVTLSTSIVSTGIALFILLPVLRVLLMLIIFLRERNYLFGMISGIVLITIGVSVVVGLYMPAAH